MKKNLFDLAQTTHSFIEGVANSTRQAFDTICNIDLAHYERMTIESQASSYEIKTFEVNPDPSKADIDLASSVDLDIDVYGSIKKLKTCP